MSFFSKNRLFWFVTALVVIYVALLFRYLHYAEKRQYSDFRVYHATGQRFAERQDIYARPDESITPFKYSPFFAMGFAPLSVLPIKAAAGVFFTLNFLAFILSLVIARRLLPAGSSVPVFWLYAISVLFCFRFVWGTWNNGQVGLWMGLLTLAGVYFTEKGKSMRAGACIAAAALIKYMPVLFIPYFLFRKKVKAAVASICFFAVFLAVPALWVGIDRERAYLASWMPSIKETSYDDGSWWNFKNQSLYAWVSRSLAREAPYNATLKWINYNQSKLAGLALAVFLYAAILLTRRRSTAVDAGLLLIAMVLFNPNAWLHNFCLLILPAMVMVYYARNDRLVLSLGVLAWIFLNAFSESLVGNALENRAEELSVTTMGALILFMSLLRIRQFRRLNSTEVTCGQSQ